MRQWLISTIVGIILLAVGIGTGYGLRAATEPLPQMHVTTQAVHVTTQVVNPNTLNQYCIVQYGTSYLESNNATAGYGRESEYIQCAPTPLPGQERYQP